MATANDSALLPRASAADQTSDRDLLHRYRGGNEDAATELYFRYANRLKALARAKCGSSLARCIDVDDIVQSVFRTFFRVARLGEYDVPDGEDLWRLFLVISLNKIRAKGAFHLAAKRDVRMTAPVDCADPSLQDQLHDDPWNPVLMQMAVEEALAQLDERQREIVELRMRGHEVAEIAERTGRSKRTVERNLQEIRTKLKTLLAQDT
jgi:RNA polymerase sigma-70 factor (ECF subfamily)